MAKLIDELLKDSEHVMMIATRAGLYSFVIVQDGDTGHSYIVPNEKGLVFDESENEWAIPFIHNLHNLGMMPLADDYKTAIVTSAEFYAKMEEDTKNPKPDNLTLESKLESLDDMSPHDIRSLILDIDKSLKVLSEKRSSLITALNKQGFMLFSDGC